jgi:hypothetical protein
MSLTSLVINPKRVATRLGKGDITVVRERKTREEKTDYATRERANEPTARGYYGRALREGWVHERQKQRLHSLDTFLRWLNVLIGVLLLAFMGWRVYVVYIVGDA